MSASAARIYDVRYSRYSGSLQPRWRSVLALARSSAGRALGLRRSAGSKVWPFLLVAVAFAPAIVAVGIPLLVPLGESPTTFLPYPQLLMTTSLIVVAYGATTIPSLLTRERRDHVLSLYFSTAVSPVEYVIAKVFAALALLLLVTMGPGLVLFLGSVLTAEAPVEHLTGNLADLPRVVGAGLLGAAFHAMLGLAIGALTAKRVFAVGGYLAALLVTPVLAGLLYTVTSSQGWLAVDLVSSPFTLAGRLFPADQQFGIGEGPPTALLWTVWTVVVLGGALVLALRYRKGQDR